MHRTTMFLVILGFSCQTFAGWWEVQQLDADLQLQAARHEALRSFASSPSGSQAVAIAGWWYGSLENLADPGEILEVAPSSGDPAVAFLLGLIASELDGNPPHGSISEFELSGPWGVAGVLDVKRGAMPPPEEAPPPGTPWAGPGSRFNYRIGTESGHLRAPNSLTTDGMIVAATSLSAGSAVDGWLVLEARGSFILEIDGIPVDRVHLAGIESPGVLWYRFRAEPGHHKVRVALAPAGEAAARLTFFDTEGIPVVLTTSRGGDQPSAESEVKRLDPPSFTGSLNDRDDASSILLAAEMARLRGDSRAQKRALDHALTQHPSEPLVHLANAAFSLFEQTAAAPEVDAQRTREHLRLCTSLKISILVDRLLAHRQGRREDVERLKDVLWEIQSDDARVLRAQLTIAVNNGWEIEVDRLLGELETALGPTEQYLILEVESYAPLGRGADRRQALLKLHDEAPHRSNQIGEMLDGCLADEALAVAEWLKRRIADPDLDADIIRLLLALEHRDDARDALGDAFDRWGRLPALEDLELALADGDEQVARTLGKTLVTQPGDLGSRSLSWHRGEIEPFWSAYRVDALEFAKASDISEEDVDAVLLLDQAVERVFADGSSLYYYHGISKALTPAGATQISTLEQMAGNERLALRIIKPDGSVISPSEVADDNGRVVMNDVEPGDLVEEEYVASVAGFSPAIRGHLSPFVYRLADSDRNFGLSEYVLLVDHEVDLKVDGFFEGLSFTDSTEGLQRVLHWRSKDVPAVPNEPFAPPSQELLPWVTYGFGVTWQDIGDGLRDRLVVSLRSSPELDEFAAERLSGDDPVASLKRLVGDLLDRVESGPTLLDLGSTAAVAFSRGRGNRLGVLAGALVAADWSTDLVLSRPAPLAGAHLAVPSRDLFGSPLLRVHRDDREIWIDLHDDALGVDSISPLLQGSDALILPMSDLERPVSIEGPLPTFDNPHLVERNTLDVAVDDNGNVRLDVTTWLQETEATRLVENLESVPRDRVPMVYSRIANNIFPGASKVVGSILEEDDEIGLHLELELEGGCEKDEGELTCRVLVLNQPLAPLLASLPERNYPLVLQLPIKRRFETTIRPAAGWSVKRPPRQLDTRWGSVQETLVHQDGVVRSVLELDVPAVVVSPEDYPAFSRFCRAVDELVGRPLVLGLKR